MELVIEFVLNVLGALVVGLMLGLATLLFLQTVVAFFSRRAATAVVTGTRPRIAILVPAHNEAAGIAATLATILPQMEASDRLVVIADNCSDDTALVAERAGVTVIERTELALRGKGYALDFGVRFLAADPPDVVLTFDADCVAGPDCIRTLAVEANRHRRPVQALYVIRAANDSIASRLSELAQRMHTQVRPLGMWRLGLPCQLMGSGMGFHWSLLERQSLASGHLTEDLQVGLEFARQRCYPQYCPAALVDSRFVADRAGVAVQQTRWEHGHLATIVAEWPSLAARSILRLDPQLAFMAWDLAVPPLALYSTLLISVSLLALGVGATTGIWWPALCFGIAILMLLSAITIAQRGFARDLVSLRELFLAVPLYLIRKGPVYVRFVFRRQVEWVRTKRDVG